MDEKKKLRNLVFYLVRYTRWTTLTDNFKQVEKLDSE